MTDKTPEELYQERNKRVSEAVRLQIPHRVPIVLSFGYFPAKYAGITCALTMTMTGAGSP